MSTPDTLNIQVSRKQAERLLALVDAANAQVKNCAVGYLADASNHPVEEQASYVEKAIALSLDSEFLTTLRANLYRRLDGSLAR